MKRSRWSWMPRGGWTAVAVLLIMAVSTVGCHVSGASVELLPMDRWDFQGPRTLSLIEMGPEGATTQPIASITTVGCLQIWTPLQ